MNTKHFPLNLQSNAALSKLRNFGGGGGLNTPNPPRYATDLNHRITFINSFIFPFIPIEEMVFQLHAEVISGSADEFM